MTSDPIRARLDDADRRIGRSTVHTDALRAVLDLLDDPPVPSRMLIVVLREAIHHHLLGVTDGDS